MDEKISEPKSGSCEPISDDEIDETLAETFPASDPPSWTLGVEANCRTEKDKDENKNDPQE